MKPSRNEPLHRVLLQGQLQQHGLVLEKVKAVAGNAGAAVEVDQVVLLGKLHVVEHRKTERPHVDLSVPQFLAGVCAADRRLRMREVRNRVVDHVRLGGQAIHVRLDFLLELANPPAVVLAGFPLGIRLGLPDRLADQIRLPRKLLHLGLQLPPLRLEFDEPRNIDLHAAAVAVFLN